MVFASGKFSSFSAKSDIFLSAPPSRVAVATTSSTVTGEASTVLAISATSRDIAKPSARTVLTNVAVSSTCLAGAVGGARAASSGGRPMSGVEGPVLATEYSREATLGNPAAPSPSDLSPLSPLSVEPLDEPIVTPSSADFLSVDFLSADFGVGTGAPWIAAISGSWLTRCSICFRSTSAGGFRRSCDEWTTRYSGMVAFNGKCSASVLYPTVLSTEPGSVLLSS